ncbi:MAG: PAS domain-containing protein [Deltaproteobacteria bacterium]|nr:PAS domain-containing protein [Deltaproteobacteria bacterium]
MSKIFLSLSYKIILIFAAVLASILFVFFLSYNKTKGHLERLILKDLNIIAGNAGGGILAFLEMNERRMADFASDGFIRDELEMLVKDGRPDGRALSRYIVKNKLPLDRNINRISVFSPGGRIAASTAEGTIGKDVSMEEFFLKGRDAAAVIERDDGYGGEPELAFSTPVYSRHTGKPIGVLTGFMPASQFSRILTGEARGPFAMDVRKGSRTMETYVVNRSRLMLTKSRFFESSPLTTRVDTAPVGRCLAVGEEMTGFYRDYRGVEVAGSARCIPSLGWTLVVEIDKDEALRPVFNMQKYLLASFGAVIMVIIGLLVYIARGVIMPLKGLSSAAKEIADGNYDINVPVSSADEIGSLAWSFNSMAGGIKERTFALKNSEERLKAVLDNTANIISIKDREGRYLLLNRRYEEVFDVNSADMLGKTDYDIFPKDLADRLAYDDRRAFESGRPIEIEERAPSAGGELRDYITIKFSLKDAQGRPYAVCGVATDITDLRRSHEALKKSEASLANAQRMAHIGNWDWDIVKNELHWSDEIYNVFGLDRQSFEKTHEAFLKCVHPMDREFVKNSVQEALDTAKPYSIDHRIVLPGGDVRVVHEQGEVARDEGRKAVTMSGTVQDITDRKKAEDEARLLNAELEGRVMRRTEELRNANKELEAFSYSVAHDLRAPLRIIDGFSNALLEDYGDRLDDHGHDYLKRVRDASRRMDMLIDDLLNLSRVVRASLHREDIDLSALAWGVAAELTKNEPGRKVDFLISAGLKVNADQRLVRVALQNLFGNAWKFTSKKENAIIEFGGMGEEGGKTVYFVRDNGAGFNMNYVDKLFGAFQRLHAVADFSGTGIGLATVQRIIHRHGGRVWAEGAEGEGAIFYFTL